MARKSQVVARPTHLVNLHTTVTHSTGGPAALRQEEAFHRLCLRLR